MALRHVEAIVIGEDRSGGVPVADGPAVEVEGVGLVVAVDLADSAAEAEVEAVRVAVGKHQKKLEQLNWNKKGDCSINLLSFNKHYCFLPGWHSNAFTFTLLLPVNKICHLFFCLPQPISQPLSPPP